MMCFLKQPLHFQFLEYRTQPNPYTQNCIYTGLMLINYILQSCEDRVSTYMRHAEIKDLSPIIIIIIIISLLAVNILSEDPLG